MSTPSLVPAETKADKPRALTITVDPEVHIRLKAYADRNGQKMQFLASKWIGERLSELETPTLRPVA